MKTYRFILEPYKVTTSRHRCPSCNHRKTFSRYIDTETGNELHYAVGRCDRENNCGYHLPPKQYFQDKGISFEKDYSFRKPQPIFNQQKKISFIKTNYLEKSLNAYEENNFVQFLIGRFSGKIARELERKYFIGTSKLWAGATVFWQVDVNGNIRTGKIMLYNASNGKRVKKPYNHIGWAHKALKMSEFNLEQCFFGEHLLIEKEKTVAIVESEKTAVIASIYFPDLIWLATGGSGNLNSKLLNRLEGRKILVFPDVNSYEKWNCIIRAFPNLKISISNLLERNASEEERKQGFDLADYLLKHNYLEFISGQNGTLKTDRSGQ